MALTELNLNQKKQKSITEMDMDEEGNLLIDEEDLLDGQDDEDTDDDEEINEEELQDDPQEDETEETTEEQEGSDEDESNSSEKDTQVELSKRAQERVRQVVAQKNAARAKLIAERKEKIEIQNKMIETQEKTVQTSKAFLENHIQAIKKLLKKAHEESNNDEIVELQEQLNEAQLNMSVFDSWKKPEALKFDENDFKDLPEEDPEEVASKDQDPLLTAPKAVRDWASKNTWFRNPKTDKDKERLEEAILYASVLDKKGIKMDSPEYFKMIDKRLKSLGLAEESEDDVESNKTSSKTENNESEGRKAKNVVQKKKVTQTVQSANRGTTSQGSPKSSKNKIVLTKAQQEMADRLGISYRDYALEIRKMEDAEKRGERMVRTFE